jgi:undecaprenyl phosphate N,N'-diacetylbacillosamine 1-phosphate transferase
LYIYIALKRIIDICISLIAMPIVLLIILIFGILIKIEDKGPIFYMAQRVGKNGVVFKMFKLRSMYINAPDIRLEDGSTYNSDNDYRVTKIGRLLRKASIDEIPQIINILFGDMTLIGPRPSTPYWLTICKEEEKEIMKVAPGLTGYNQAYFRNSISDEQKYKNDLWYVRNMSFFIDIKIFLKTIYIIFKREKVYKELLSEKTNILN